MYNCPVSLLEVEEILHGVEEILLTMMRSEESTSILSF